jgi:uncharacterized membrane protein
MKKIIVLFLIGGASIATDARNNYVPSFSEREEAITEVLSSDEIESLNRLPNKTSSKYLTHFN